MFWRFVKFSFITFLTLLFVASLALWAFLTVWVPTDGKALLIEQAQERWPISLEIGSMGYSPLRGLTLDRIAISPVGSKETWLQCQQATARIRWWSLPRRMVDFRIKTSLTKPAQAGLIANGHYRWESGAWKLRLRLEDAAMNTLSSLIAGRLPGSVREGSLRTDLFLRGSPKEPIELSGFAEASGVSWEDETYQASADFVLEGSAIRAPNSEQPWDAKAVLGLHRGSLVTPTSLGTITGIEGSSRLDAKGMILDSLRGTAFGAPVEITGAFGPWRQQRFELLATGEFSLGGLGAFFDPGLWTIDGQSDLTAVCRGAAGVLPDCQIRADLYEASVMHSINAVGLENIQGPVLYDALADSMSTGLIPAVADGQEVALKVSVKSLRKTPSFDLSARFPEGTLAMSGSVKPSKLLLEASSLLFADSKVELTGEASLSPAVPSQLTLRGIVEPASLSRLPFAEGLAKTLPPVEGKLAVGLRYNGLLLDWKRAEFKGQVGADRLLFAGTPFEEVRIEFQQSQGKLQARTQHARIANGLISSEFLMVHAPKASNFQWQADATNLELNLLARAVPKLAGREIQGNASAHAIIQGAWNQQPSWKGEGWLNAQGDRLGDLPLLDTLIQKLFGTLGGRLKLESLNKAKVQKISLRWQLADSRIITDDLRLGALAGTDPMAVYISGSLGLDRTLDFVIEPEFSEQTVLTAPTTASTAQEVLQVADKLEKLRRLVGRHRLTGTVDKPIYRFELGVGEALKQVTPGPANLLQGIIRSLQ